MEVVGGTSSFSLFHHLTDTTLGEDDNFQNLVKVLKRKFRRPEYVMFLLFQPAPAALEIYAVYRLTDARE